VSRPRGGGPDGRRSWRSSRCWRRATAPQRSLHSRRSCRTNVTRVVDGDTIYVAIGNQIEKVRYIGWQGYAEAATYPPNVRYADYFVGLLQRHAREARHGLWADPDAISYHRPRPPDYAAEQPQLPAAHSR